MADIKTNLRELSVGTYLGMMIRKISMVQDKLYDFDYFKANTIIIFGTDIKSKITNILELNQLDKSSITILKNGYNLAKTIYNSSYFSFSAFDQIKWVGYDTQKNSVIDLKVGKYNFSLKEDSFILKNMGLYQFLNDMTGSNTYGKGLHVFKEFANIEYNDWFKYTWDSFVSYLTINKIWINKDKSQAIIYGDIVKLFYNNKISTIPTQIKTIDEFDFYTTSQTREKVFSKRISAIFSQDPAYINYKKICSQKAGKIITQIIKDNFNYHNIDNFFQIEDEDYFYAKTTLNNIEIFKVPSKSNLKTSIKFIDCYYEIPESQLNIITKFQNLDSKKFLEFRNECRFSHGQFNGTPEAKLYIRRGSSLDEIYDAILKSINSN